MTPIEMIPSAGIRAALIANGDHYAIKLGTYEHPRHVGNADWRVTLWILPCNEWVLETNGDPVFETDGEPFDVLWQDYGLPEAARASGVRRCFRKGFPLMVGSARRDSCVYFKSVEEAHAWVKKYGHYYFTEAAR